AGVEAGLAVDLLLGPTHLAPPEGCTVHRFVSAIELDALAEALWPDVDALVATAAVCDYRPAERIAGKRKKEPGDWNLRLVRNPDVLGNRAREKGERRLIGFALESTDGTGSAAADARRREALRKLEQKSLDVIILNGPANMGAHRGVFEWIDARSTQASAGDTPDSPTTLTKPEIARRIIEFLVPSN
ncbi:MAG: hypothetical protein KDC38_14060, partial [Planctomycetes bacterium]|nr:hypothetical protein [Planctomycetota bacterium]